MEEKGHEPRNAALEAGKGNKKDFLLHSPKGAISCQHLNFSPGKLILNF
jgi:hypothetical protein